MKRSLVTVGLLLLVACNFHKEDTTTSIPPIPQSENQIRKEILRKACKVKHGLGGGSGSYLTRNWVLTAYHVVSEEVPGIESMSWVEENGDLVDFRLHRYSEALDLALLFRDSAPPEEEPTWNGTMAGSVELGQRVYTAGFPVLQGPYLTDGYISRLHSTDGMYVSIQATFGSSGSGIYDTQGRLVGVVQQIWVMRGIPMTFMLLSCTFDDLRLFLRT